MAAMDSTDAELLNLIQSAERGLVAGNIADAKRILAQAKALAPDHPFVHNALGMLALKSGETSTARSLFEKATNTETRIATFWLNLAMACRVLQDFNAERGALDKALAIDPYFFLALLQKAMLLERLGNTREAAGVFQAFLSSLPREAKQAPSLQQAITHAQAAVHKNNAALELFLTEKLRDIRLQNDTSDQRRIDDSINVLLGKKQVFTQQPTFMHVPYLPAIPFYDRGEFPCLGRLENATSDILGELEKVVEKSVGDFVPYVANPAGTPLNQWKELDHSPRWSAFHLWYEGLPIDQHLKQCPKAMRILAEIPSPNIAGHGPNAFFSRLAPHTRIPPHTGVTNARLVIHLPLIVPKGCAFRVGSETREWKVGEAWVFDDTIEHEAWNDGDEPRVILICDIWNPRLTRAEIDLVRSATESIAEFYGNTSQYQGSL